MEVFLDTNFIISCILKRIDFIEELGLMGFKVRIPKGVLQELKDLRRENKTSREERDAIDLAFKIINEKKVKKVRVGGKNVDHGLIEKGNDGVYIATLDRGIKVKIPNKVVIDNSRKGLRIMRD